MDLHVEAGRVARHLRTARLQLRPLARADLGPLTVMANDWSIASMLTDVPHPFGAGDADYLWTLYMAGRLGSLWVIDDGTGFCGLITIRPEIGYWLARDKWGRGYMTEALRAAIAAWFGAVDGEAIPASYFHDNIGSGIVLRKLGFQQVSLHMQQSEARGEEVMSFAMALSRQRWQAVARDRPPQPFTLARGGVALRETDRRDLIELPGSGLDAQMIARLAYRGNPPQAHPFLLTVCREGWPVGLAYVDHTPDGLSVTCQPAGPHADAAACAEAKQALEEHGATHWGTAPLENGRGVA